MRLTTKEEEIMNIMWKLGKAFPKEIMAYIKKPLPPYNTVLSLIRKLEKDGWLGYQKFGKSHQYYPKVLKKEYSKSLFKKLYQDYMGGSREMLLSYFMKEENVDIKELEQLVKDIKAKNNSK